MNPDDLQAWCYALREWYFDTHRLLNGTLTMTGTTEYIAVGDNIKFDAGVLNPTHNMNKKMLKEKESYVLAHVENISHSFQVSQDGARQYQTTIQFVRGVIVNGDNVAVGDAAIDKFATSTGKDAMTYNETRNTVNTVNTSTELDPDKLKNNGT